MVKLKRVLAVVLSLVMLYSCFAVSANALTYAPTNTTGSIKVVTTADKTTVKKGDVVQVTLALSTTDPAYTAGGYFGSLGNVVIYNSKQLTPCDAAGNATTKNTDWRTWVNSAANWINPTATCNFNYSISQLTALTEEEKAYYDKTVLFTGTPYSAGGAINQAGTGWEPEAYCTFTMKVSDTVSPGDEIWVGLHQATFTKGVSYFGPSGGRRMANTVYDLTNSMVKLTVASDTPVSTSIVNPFKEQIRFDKNADGTDAGTFDYRYLAKITAKDFNNTFGTEAEAIDKIQEIGFVFAYQETVPTFDTAAAKALVENGTAAEGYVKKPVSYISNADGDYVFSCLVTDIAAGEKTTGAHAFAYVKYTNADGATAYAYYDTVTSSTFTALYDNYHPQAFPTV